MLLTLLNCSRGALNALPGGAALLLLAEVNACLEGGSYFLIPRGSLLVSSSISAHGVQPIFSLFQQSICTK